MKWSLTKRLLSIGLILQFVISGLIFGSPNWSDLRKLEPVIIQADSFPEFINSEISHIFAYNYAKKLNRWQQIPFQIDEKGWEISTNFYDSTKIDTVLTYFGQTDGLLDEGEEFVFMVQDAGDKAPDNSWIADTNSRDFVRCEISIRDPLNPAQVGYVYFYQSKTLTPTPTLPDYVALTPASSDTTGDDRIEALSYVEGHDLQGFTTEWRIPPTYQGTNADILDFLKMRLKVDVGIVIKLLEVDALRVRKLDHVDGRIRVIRRLNYFLEFVIFTEPIGIADFTTYFYPFHADSRGPKKRLDPDWGISYLRQSFDLSSDAIGMHFYNPFNSHILIDGIPDETVSRTLYDYPALNWHLVTGDPGSILFSYVLQPLGTTRELYYFDNDAESSGDGFGHDSGDEKSYGDIGIALSGERLEGSFGMSYKALFLGARQDPAIGQSYLTHSENPIQLGSSALVYDIIPPAAITDLQVSDYSVKSITLSWTAPGDDGMTGAPVKGYEIYYSRWSVLDDLDEWLMFASSPKTTPPGAAPGTTQHTTIMDLEAYTQYYFVMRSYDDMGSFSDYSNVASGTSYPVELMSFTASVQKNKVELRWKTASEKNNHGFEIERKLTSTGSRWKQIGFVKGFGTTAEPQVYSFVDKIQTAGTVSYRLKQIDRDGNFTYSTVQQVDLSRPKTFALSQNYPNPFNPVTWINFQIPQLKKAESAHSVILKIYNIKGEEIRSFNLSQFNTGRHQIKWNGLNQQGQKVSAGVYFYHLVTPEIVLSRKMILLP